MEIILIILYAVILLYTIGLILLNTDSTPKTLAYLLLVFAIPVIGIIIYFAFGINLRHQQSRSTGMKAQHEFDKDYFNEIPDGTDDLIKADQDEINHYLPMVKFLNGLSSEILYKSHFHLLINGEEKFPEVLRTLETAKDFIHMEYYDWENDTRGNQIKEVLLKKAREGLKIRVLYDDYASSKIKHNIVKELKNGNVDIYPKIKVRLRQFANRVNHRDHRKLIIVDGKKGFVGGINISDRYDNSIDTGLYWRDTHVKITGSLVRSIQRHFIVSWNSSSPEKLKYNKELFPEISNTSADGISAVGQIVAGGPIYPQSNIMLSYSRIFSLSREKLYITNPYFIPSDSIMDTMKQAAISGVDVRLMVPFKSDSAIVGAASRFYFTDLLAAGVKIFLYKKGFVHAKTVVADGILSVVGTANMDIRSFDLNFEITSVIYGSAFAKELEAAFIHDLNECHEITLSEWKNIGITRRLIYAVARLISSFL